MDVDASNGGGAGEPRRKGAKARAPKGDKVKAVRKSLNLRVDEDSYQRLNVHALYRDKTVSELVMEYAQTLREFVVHRRSAGGADGQEQGAA